MSITEELVFMVTPLWPRCPHVFVHWVVFRRLSQGLALICGPDCDSFVGAIWCGNSRGRFFALLVVSCWICTPSWKYL